ncbi:MAG: hypothetical protein ABJG41_10875 [Cyclobacteriaceae bacterium]
MTEQRKLFDEIRDKFISDFPKVKAGKMMSSDAIHFDAKVFAFISRKDKMVFKLGKDFNIHQFDYPVTPFSPFKTKAPLSGWYEVDYEYHHRWEEMTHLSLELINP